MAGFSILRVDPVAHLCESDIIAAADGVSFQFLSASAAS
jgi:hypothetical protein